MARKAAETVVESENITTQVLNPIYTKLNQLQSVVAKKFDIEDRKTDIPKDLEDKKTVLQKTSSLYLELHEKSEHIKEDIKNLTISLTEATHNREEDEKKMETISLSREFDILTKQIEDDKQMEQTCRKNLISKKNYAEELEAKLSEQEAIMNEQEQEVKEEEERKDALMNECINSQKECEEEIKHGSEGIPEAVMNKFERIIRNKQGVGIVPVHGIECMGCHMTLPLQFVNEVRAVTFSDEVSEDDIKFCPYCSRVLYYEQADGSDVINSVQYQSESEDTEEPSADTSFADAVGEFSLDV